MNTKAKIKVGIVDDNRATIQSLTEFLNYSDSTKVVVVAQSGIQLLQRLKALDKSNFPDLILTDVNMPDMNGIETVIHGKILYPQLKFLMLTVYDDDDSLFQAIQAGANGYLMKDEKIDVIIDHIEHLILENGAPMSPRIARKTLALLQKTTRPVKQNEAKNVDEKLSLTKRELEVLQLIVDGHDYKGIAALLVLSPNTVRKHIANIYAKLHVNSKAQAIKIANKRNLFAGN